MITKLYLIFSIAVNTLGLHGWSNQIDHDVLSKDLNPGIKVEASNSLPLPPIFVKPRISVNAPAPKINSKSSILIDSDSGTVLAQSQPNLRVPVASTTKIMTADIVIEEYNLDDVITFSKEAASQIGVDETSRAGVQVTVRNLLQILLINSSNRCAYALAEHYNRTGESGVQKFVDRMNQKAKELGMKDTEFHDPAGLDVTGWSSAFDLTVITKYALKKPLFAQIVGTKEATVTDVTGKVKYDLKNSNRLVREWNYAGAIGVKTGYMPEASHCLVAAVRRDGHTLISVVLGTYADTAPASAEESKKLLDWGFKNTVWSGGNSI
jgi:D-alanyl-D-alanine carboxypeptidase (penicillin-binding protein 5/6)